MKLTKKHKRMLFRILLATLLFGVAVFANALWLPDLWYFQLPVFLLPYLLVGYDVLWRAVRNLFHGQLLDENFLMCIATVGALAISEYPEAVFVMLFYQIGELFQSVAVHRSRKSIAELMDIRPDEARVLRNGEEQILSPDEVQIGEELLVRAGEKIPLDGIVTEGNGELNTASLTGESLPREVSVGDEVISGCVNMSGLLRIRVTKPFEESTVSKILELVECSALAKSKTERAVTKFAHIYTPAVVISAVLLAVLPSLFTGDWQRWIYSALIFLVVSCPCALVISVPLSYFAGLGKASKNGILIKGASFLEALANVRTVAFDKTGTLTEGRFRVTQIYPVGVSAETLLTLAAAAEQHSNHPIARSLCEAAQSASLPSATNVEELHGMGVRATVNGKRITVGTARLMDEIGVSYTLPKGVGTPVFVAADALPLGALLISDTEKPTAAEAVRALGEVGVLRTVMLTGDRPETAAAVASALSIPEYRASLLPADKVVCVEELLENANGGLAFVGDGVNDAPVLARADVGIAMGGLGSDAAIEAADVVLMNDDPRAIAQAIRIARKTKRIVWQNIWFALGVKLLFLLLSAFGFTNMWAATFADVGVAVIAILNATRAGRK